MKQGVIDMNKLSKSQQMACKKGGMMGKGDGGKKKMMKEKEMESIHKEDSYGE